MGVNESKVRFNNHNLGLSCQLRIELDVNTDVDTESMLWLGIAASNSLTRKTTGLAPLTSSKLHRPKIINNNDNVVEKKHVVVTLCGLTATRVVIFWVCFVFCLNQKQRKRLLKS